MDGVRSYGLLGGLAYAVMFLTGWVFAASGSSPAPRLCLGVGGENGAADRMHEVWLTAFGKRACT